MSMQSTKYNTQKNLPYVPDTSKEKKNGESNLEFKIFKKWTIPDSYSVDMDKLILKFLWRGK